MVTIDNAQSVVNSKGMNGHNVVKRKGKEQKNDERSSIPAFEVVMHK